MISARTALGSVRIEFSNHAQSLTDDDLAHLFELFWRENDSRHDRRGFGLGPAVARTLARASGGDIVATRCGSDTLTFAITMPISSESVSDLPSEGADLLSRIMKR